MISAISSSARGLAPNRWRPFVYTMASPWPHHVCRFEHGCHSTSCIVGSTTVQDRVCSQYRQEEGTIRIAKQTLYIQQTLSQGATTSSYTSSVFQSNQASLYRGMTTNFSSSSSQLKSPSQALMPFLLYRLFTKILGASNIVCVR